MALFFMSVWLSKSDVSIVVRIVISESEYTRYSDSKNLLLHHCVLSVINCFS
jgi:hypothetical protein